jgi:WD40 repeat protein
MFGETQCKCSGHDGTSCAAAANTARTAHKLVLIFLPIHVLPWQVLRAHILPLTNCAFNKSGDRFITGSYDRTCKVGAAVALQS